MVTVVFSFDHYNVLISALVTIGMQILFFIIAASCKFDKVTDFAGGSNFLVLAFLTFFLSRTYYHRQIAIFALVLLWGFRLTGFLFYRIIKIGEDKRFDGRRENVIKFAIFWFLQAVWVFTVSLPVIYINAYQSSQELQVTDYIGIAVFVFGLLIEAVADQQKFFYRNNPDNKDHWCDAGLWSFSRHPNYFGEALVWWGAFLISIGVIVDSKLWTSILSPLLTEFLLLFVSGIPALEEKADKKYKDNAEYIEYKSSTSPIILFPPFIYRKLHRCVKLVFFAEMPFYNHLNSESYENIEA